MQKLKEKISEKKWELGGSQKDVKKKKVWKWIQNPPTEPCMHHKYTLHT